MKNKVTHSLALLLFFYPLIFSQCTYAQGKPDTQFQKMMANSFRTEGIANIDRIAQDETQRFCSNPQSSNNEQYQKRVEGIQQLNMANIPAPKDGRYIGDWQKGEVIAQSGRGSTWTDNQQTVNGGGCYNCHQIDRKEIAYGNLGPSLWNYGKLRGYSQEIVIYTWKKIFNPKAFNACSAMPRFGHFKLLTQEQLQDLMALLLDPRSPVNQ